MFRLVETVASIDILQKDTDVASDFRARNSATKVRGYEEMMINTSSLNRIADSNSDFDFDKELEEEEKYDSPGLMNTTFESEGEMIMGIEEEEEMFMDAQEEIIIVDNSTLH